MKQKNNNKNKSQKTSEAKSAHQDAGSISSDEELEHGSAFLTNYAKKAIKVPKYVHQEYKIAIDDAVSKLLVQDHHFQQDFVYPDVKMLLGYLACAFAGYGGYESYLSGKEFGDVLVVLLICIAGFFILQTAMLAFAKYVEKNIVFRGIQKDIVSSTNDVSVEVSTRSPYLSDKIEIGVVVFQGLDKKRGSYRTTISVGQWFDDKGGFVAEIFKRDLEAYMAQARSSKKVE